MMARWKGNVMGWRKVCLGRVASDLPVVKGVVKVDCVLLSMF